jgi:hypothetical protein
VARFKRVFPFDVFEPLDLIHLEAAVFVRFLHGPPILQSLLHSASRFCQLGANSWNPQHVLTPLSYKSRQYGFIDSTKQSQVCRYGCDHGLAIRTTHTSDEPTPTDDRQRQRRRITNAALKNKIRVIVKGCIRPACITPIHKELDNVSKDLEVGVISGLLIGSICFNIATAGKSKIASVETLKNIGSYICACIS